MPVKKRELASYLLLYSSGREAMSIGEAGKILELMLPRRSVRSVLRILAKSGFIEVSGKEIKINRPEEALKRYLLQYILSRIEKNAKSKQIPYRIEREQDGTEKIYLSSSECQNMAISIDIAKIMCRNSG